MISLVSVARRVWPWVCLALAIFFVFQFGAIISPLLLGLSALMCASATFRDLAAQGKRVMGPVGRVVTASITAVLAFVMLPGAKQSVGQSPVQAAAAEPAELDKSAAMEMCRSPILRQLTHPSTAEFDIWDQFLQPKPGGTTMYSIGLTAKNSFGLELKLLGYCEIEDGRVNSAHVVEKTE